MITQKELYDKLIEYIDTPFKHQGRLKGVGVDCVGLVICALKELNVNIETDYKDYKRIPDGFKLFKECKKLLIEKNINEIKNGDILLMKFIDEPQHVAVFFDNKIIHALSTSKKVAIHEFDDVWKKRVVAAFKIKEMNYE